MTCPSQRSGAPKLAAGHDRAGYRTLAACVLALKLLRPRFAATMARYPGSLSVRGYFRKGSWIAPPRTVTVDSVGTCVHHSALDDVTSTPIRCPAGISQSSPYMSNETLPGPDSRYVLRLMRIALSS